MEVELESNFLLLNAEHLLVRTTDLYGDALPNVNNFVGSQFSFQRYHDFA